MLEIKLELEQINYQTCVETIFPALVEHCAAKEHPLTLDRAIAGLGADAAPAARALLDGMDDEAKDKLVVWLVTAHERRICASANRRLAEALGAPSIRIGRLGAQNRPGASLLLRASQVEIDYAALIASPLVGERVEQLGGEHSVLKGAAKLALQMGLHMPPEQLEKYCVSLLNSAKVRDKLSGTLTDALHQAGLDVTLGGIIAEADGAAFVPPNVPEGDGEPTEFENEILTALYAQARRLHE